MSAAGGNRPRDEDSGRMSAYRAVVFDLLTALLDSWTLWDDVAGGPAAGRRWRGRYLELAYAAGPYRPYADIVAEAAADAELDRALPGELLRRWDELSPWPEATAVLRRLAGDHRLAVVTNCSQELAERAADRLGVRLDVLVSAERAGFYKPRPEAYGAALEELGVPADHALFVAGSPADVPGAQAAGMPVVWHNRLGLPAVGPTPPLATIGTLTPLTTLAAQGPPPDPRG